MATSVTDAKRLTMAHQYQVARGAVVDDDPRCMILSGVVPEREIMQIRGFWVRPHITAVDRSAAACSAARVAGANDVIQGDVCRWDLPKKGQRRFDVVHLDFDGQMSAAKRHAVSRWTHWTTPRGIIIAAFSYGREHQATFDDAGLHKREMPPLMMVGETVESFFERLAPDGVSPAKFRRSLVGRVAYACPDGAKLLSVVRYKGARRAMVSIAWQLGHDTMDRKAIWGDATWTHFSDDDLRAAILGVSTERMMKTRWSEAGRKAAATTKAKKIVQAAKAEAANIATAPALIDEVTLLRRELDTALATMGVSLAAAVKGIAELGEVIKSNVAVVEPRVKRAEVRDSLERIRVQRAGRIAAQQRIDAFMAAKGEDISSDDVLAFLKDERRRRRESSFGGQADDSIRASVTVMAMAEWMRMGLRCPTGGAYEKRGAFFIRITVGLQQRVAEHVPWATSLEAATARARIIQQHVNLLRAAKRFDFIPRVIEVGARADDAKLSELDESIVGMLAGTIVQLGEAGGATRGKAGHG